LQISNDRFKRSFMSKPTVQATKDRLVAAAASLFAERGFHATSVRDIARRAGANIASGHYHYGSKKALYLEVLREQFRSVQSELRKRGASRPPEELSHLSHEQIVEVLRSRIRTMLDLLIGPSPSLHATLMQREMCDPSEALPVIVAEFIVPMTREMGEIISHLFPRLAESEVESCVRSIAGQVLFYRFAMPAMLHMQGRDEYPRGTAAKIADHITEFSLGGADRVASERKRGRRGR
jgi:AcrR family transcriptional regulator